MPELPEVETVRRQIARVWEGKKIQRVDCGPPSYFFRTPPQLLKSRLKGRTLISLCRQGKSLIANFEDDSRLLMHLGMTGQFVTGKLAQDGHVHLVIHLTNRQSLSFRDVRKFGKVEWIEAGDECTRLKKLGPDALSISAAHLREVFGKRKLVIKSALLNQGLLAGVGNIYADEILFAAKIHPLRPTQTISPKECTLLARKTRDILSRAVKAGGSTINDYVRPDGNLGGFQDNHLVYGKTNQPCPICKKPIVRRVIGARASHFCETCQQ